MQGSLGARCIALARLLRRKADSSHRGSWRLARSRMMLGSLTLFSRHPTAHHRVMDLCKDVVSAGAATLDQAPCALSLDWAEETISYWRLLISEDEPTGDRPKLPPGVSPRRSPPRSINSAGNVRVYASGGTQRPALLQLEGGSIAQLVSTIRSRAAAKGLSFQSL
jgi:hypothetical protein